MNYFAIPKETLYGKTKYTTYAIHIVCINGHKWLISGKNEVATQMFRTSRYNSDPSQPIKCK